MRGGLSALKITRIRLDYNDSLKHGTGVERDILLMEQTHYRDTGMGVCFAVGVAGCVCVCWFDVTPIIDWKDIIASRVTAIY